MSYLIQLTTKLKLIIMKSTAEKLIEIEENGYPLDFGTVFNQAFENYKKIALLVGGVILVLIFVFTLLVGSIGGLVFGISSLTSFLTDLKPSSSTSSITIITLLVGVIGAALVAPLTAGLLKIAHLAENGHEYGFGTAFDYYKSHYLKEIFTATLIISLFSSGLESVFTILKENYTSGNLKGILIFVNFIMNVSIGLLTLLTIPLIIFGDLSASAAIRGSIVLVKKRFWVILMLLFIGFIGAFVIGIIALCIGIFFTLPFIYSLEYIIYRNAMALEESNELDEIGNSDW